MATVRIIGGPGTGKTTRLIDAAVAHIADGADPESVLMLTPGRLVASARAAITSRPGSAPRTSCASGAGTTTTVAESCMLASAGRSR